jgi:hypothetical protein
VPQAGQDSLIMFCRRISPVPMEGTVACMMSASFFASVARSGGHPGNIDWLVTRSAKGTSFTAGCWLEHIRPRYSKCSELTGERHSQWHEMTNQDS